MKSLNASQYFAEFLESKGISAVFTVSGGSIHNILAELDKSEVINLVPCYNEQGAVYAAEGYARATGNIGVCLVTSGPGLTNIITGINCCWVDSIPLFVLAGQVVESQKMIHLKNPTRQRGVQESESEGLVKSIVKSYSSIEDPNDFPSILNNLWNEALDKRYGPVVLELPVDMSYKPITNQYAPKQVKEEIKLTKTLSKYSELETLQHAIENSNLPLFLIGNGARDCEKSTINEFISLLAQKRLYYASTWGSKDLIENKKNGEYYVGSPGIFGSRKANSLMYFSDCIVSIGCSLGFTHTGYRVSNINPKSLHIIDIDEAQFEKPEIIGAYNYHIDSAELLQYLTAYLKNTCKKEEVTPQLNNLFASYKEADEKERLSSKYLCLIDQINSFLAETPTSSDYIICTDMGTSFTATHSYLKCNGARLFTAAGHAPMGWGLPGAIGAAIACKTKKVICFTGDGGLLMNIQELMHMSYYNLNVKLIIINNNGYATIMNTTNRYHSKTIASAPSNGIKNPDFRQVASAYEIPYRKLSCVEDIHSLISESGPMIIEMETNPNDFIGPKLMMSSGDINELLNMSPFLSENVFSKIPLEQ